MIPPSDGQADGRPGWAIAYMHYTVARKNQCIILVARKHILGLSLHTVNLESPKLLIHTTGYALAVSETVWWTGALVDFAF